MSVRECAVWDLVLEIIMIRAPQGFVVHEITMIRAPQNLVMHEITMIRAPQNLGRIPDIRLNSKYRIFFNIKYRNS